MKMILDYALLTDAHLLGHYELIGINVKPIWGQIWVIYNVHTIFPSMKYLNI